MAYEKDCELVTTLKGTEYIRALAEDGSTVRIPVVELGKVMAQVMPVATSESNGAMPSTFFLNGSYKQITVQYNTEIRIGRVRGFLMLQRPWDKISVSLFFIDASGINVICDKDNLFRLLSVVNNEVYYTEPAVGHGWIKCWFQDIPFSYS